MENAAENKGCKAKRRMQCIQAGSERNARENICSEEKIRWLYFVFKP